MDQLSKLDKERELRRIAQSASGDSKSKTDRSAINNSSIKKASRHNGTLSQSKSSVKNEATTKSHSNSSRTSVNTRTIKVKPQVEKQVIRLSKQTESSKSKEKIKSNVSEKRGLSTIYVPESNASKLKSLSTKQPSDTKILQSKKSHDKNDIIVDNKRKRPSSRERRRSRTLSPSEVRVLHSKAAIQNQNEKQSKNIEGAAKPDSDEDFDYEDDFEVGSKFSLKSISLFFNCQFFSEL